MVSRLVLAGFFVGCISHTGSAKGSGHVTCENQSVLASASAYLWDTRWADWEMTYSLLTPEREPLSSHSNGINILLGLTTLTQDDVDCIFRDISSLPCKQQNTKNTASPTFTQQQLHNYFLLLDKDGDGVFSGEEFQDYWAKLQPRLPDLGCPIGPLDFASDDWNEANPY